MLFSGEGRGVGGGFKDMGVIYLFIMCLINVIKNGVILSIQGDKCISRNGRWRSEWSILLSGDTAEVTGTLKVNYRTNHGKGRLTIF